MISLYPAERQRSPTRFSAFWVGLKPRRWVRPVARVSGMAL